MSTFIRQFFVLLVVLVVHGTTNATRSVSAQDGKSLAGQLLIASHKIGDSRFTETVVFMVRHNTAQGAMGLVVNKPMLSTSFASLSEYLRVDVPKAHSEDQIVVHYGGPMQPNQGFMGFILHSPDVLVEDSMVVTNNIAMTARGEMLQLIARGDGPAKSLFVLGYAVWAPHQLEWEIKQGAWLMIPSDEALVFAEDPGHTWERAVTLRGFDL